MILRGNVYSRMLEMDTGITVIIPQERTAPPPRIAYVLHGLCGNNSNWTDYTLLPLYALDYNVVMVMPEIGRSFYTDMKYGQKYFSYVADELPEIVASAFRVSSTREDTAVIGGSMGGYGALKVALSRPDCFARCCALSSACLYLKSGLEALRTHSGQAQAKELYSEQLIRDFQSAFGPNFEWNESNDILSLAENLPLTKRPSIYCACGSEDELKDENRRFVSDLRRLDYDIVYEELPGSHNWHFFDAALKNALAFCFGKSKA